MTTRTEENDEMIPLEVDAGSTETPPHLPPTELTATGRPVRSMRGQLPARYRDILPQAAIAVPAAPLEVHIETQGQEPLPAQDNSGPPRFPPFQFVFRCGD